MSNLFKTGITGFTPIDSKPFIIESNNRIIENKKNASSQGEKEQGKIIRPYEERKEQEQANENSLNEAKVQAELLLQAAKAQADEIIQNANVAATEIFENAKSEGFEQGLVEGNSEAMKRADEYLLNLQREQDELVQKFDEEKNIFLKDAEEKIIDISCMLIEKMTGVLVENYKSVMLHMINSALNEEEASNKLIIKVPSESYLYISDNKERLLGATNPSILMEIYEDMKLKPGQCIIETDNGIVDLSMDIQVKNLITAIKILSE